jgi:signal transduction histidine kinase
MAQTLAFLKEFFRRRMLWVGLAAVAIPLCAHLWQQYEALVNLQETMPLARKVYMRRYLNTVLEKTVYGFEEQADKTLNVPADAYHYRYPPTPDKYSEPYDHNKVFDSEVVWNHFSQRPFRGARLLFVGIVAGPTEPMYSQVLYYDPVACRLKYRVSEQEKGAAHAAAAAWTAFTMLRVNPKNISLSVDERDPNNRIIVKPIVDDQLHLVGVAGMFVDEKVFIQEYLASTIRNTLPASFPDEYKDAVVLMSDWKEKVYYSSQEMGENPIEVMWQFPFVFKDRYLAMKMRTISEEQWSRRYFLNNLLFAALTAAILIGGVLLALQAASRAMKLSQMKADFVSNVSHELRTPLASIRVFGEFLRLGRVRDQAKIHEYGEYIENESRRLTQLINNILDFSKIESGQKTYHFERSYVEQIIADTLKTLEVMIEQHGFSIQFDRPAAPLPQAMVDPEAIAQAFINLLDNAVKYSGESKRIDIHVRGEDNFVAVAVTDYGVGISGDERDKVFEKFYRVGNSLVHDVKGSGLGLSIVKHIIEAHRGRVVVESELGRGSTFTILLPTDPSVHTETETKSELVDRHYGVDSVS